MIGVLTAPDHRADGNQGQMPTARSRRASLTIRQLVTHRFADPKEVRHAELGAVTGNIGYEDTGDGPVVLLLHGVAWTGRCGGTWWRTFATITWL